LVIKETSKEPVGLAVGLTEGFGVAEIATAKTEIATINCCRGKFAELLIMVPNF
jgi:hypothetical protein